jgi:viroplasmin and RNaseH domain-containing protein
MEENGVSEYALFGNIGHISSDIGLGDRVYYAVANGHKTGIYECFQYVYHQYRAIW